MLLPWRSWFALWILWWRLTLITSRKESCLRFVANCTNSLLCLIQPPWKQSSGAFQLLDSISPFIWNIVLISIITEGDWWQHDSSQSPGQVPSPLASYEQTLAWYRLLSVSSVFHDSCSSDPNHSQQPDWGIYFISVLALRSYPGLLGIEWPTIYIPFNNILQVLIWPDLYWICHLCVLVQCMYKIHVWWYSDLCTLRPSISWIFIRWSQCLIASVVWEDYCLIFSWMSLLHVLEWHYHSLISLISSDCLTDIRQNLAAPRLLGKNEGSGNHLSDLLQGLNSSLLDQMKSVLANLQVRPLSLRVYCSNSRAACISVSMSDFSFLQAFIASDITFAMKPYFRGPFCSQDVREGLVVAFLNHITSVCIVSHFPLWWSYLCWSVWVSLILCT